MIGSCLMNNHSPDDIINDLPTDSIDLFPDDITVFLIGEDPSSSLEC